LRPALERTLGVPLFQEQLMQIAIDVAGFTPTEADELRQAMSAKRSGERMARLRDRLFAGMAARQVSTEVSEQVYAALAAFANFGFPESHSVAFAHLVYSTAWCKVHYPAAFTAGLLNAQPMGFWSPQSLIADAKRHGVEIRRPDANASRAGAWLEDGAGGSRETPVIRLGLSSVRGIGDETAERIADGQPWSGMEDLVRRAGVSRAQLETLATAGALDGLSTDRSGRSPAGGNGTHGSSANGNGPAAGGRNRRSLVWTAGAAAQATADRLPGVVTGSEPPPLPAPTPWEGVADDLWSLGMAPDITAMELMRPRLDELGVTRTDKLDATPAGSRITVGGVVTHRQQPESAHGAVFLNLEDETGMINVVCSRGAWVRWKSAARSSRGLLVRGRLERSEGATNLIAERIDAIELGPVPPSRDFR
jgi:error-prone DNA polymerase